jgi:hypothetical protein
MNQQTEREQIMEYVLLCSSIDGSQEDTQELAEILQSTGIKTPRQLYCYSKDAIEFLLNQGKVTHARHLQLNNLIRWMKTYITQDEKQRKPADLTKSLQTWKQTMTRETFKEFINSGEIQLPPTACTPEPKSITKKRNLPDPPGCHINECKTHVPTLVDDPIPTTPARTIDPGDDKPNLPRVCQKPIPEEAPTPAPATLAPEEIIKARHTPSPTTVMSHPTWEYWCHSSTPFRGAYPSYDDDYCNSNNLPTMATPTPTPTSDICIIGDPPYQLRGG